MNITPREELNILTALLAYRDDLEYKLANVDDPVLNEWYRNRAQEFTDLIDRFGYDAFKGDK